MNQLTRELAAAIREADPAGSTGVRDFAIELLREESEPSGAPSPPGSGQLAPGPLNPFAFGLPVLVVGGLLTFLFAPVGLLLVAAGAVICGVGIALAVGRSLAQRWRGQGPPATV